MIKSSETRQVSLGDFFTNPKNMQTRKKEFFEKISTVINWKPIIYRIEEVYSKDSGRPAFPVLVMFKALLLSQWYGLSDPELEDCMKDRISFKQFVGLGMEDDIPDETTICRFRNRLVEKRLLEKLFRIINRQLEEKGFFVKSGTLIDATIVNADMGNKATRDKEGSFTKKGGRTYFGYKCHVGMDYRSHLIRKLHGTTAKVSDCKVWDELLSGDEKSVFADKAYVDDKYKAYLRESGIYCGVLDRARTNHPLSGKQKKLNKKKSRVRSNVERVFAVFKRQYKYYRARYRGLTKNTEHFFALGIAYNLQRAVRLTYC